MDGFRGLARGLRLPTEDFERAGKDGEHQRQGTQVTGRPKGYGCSPCVMK